MKTISNKTPPPINKKQYETLAAFRYNLRKFIHFSENAAVAKGITPQQHQALLAIKGFPSREEVTVGELAERLQLRHHSAVGLVDRLVEENLILRHRMKTDRRQVWLRLTRKGAKILEQLSQIHRTEMENIGPTLRTLLECLGTNSS